MAFLGGVLTIFCYSFIPFCRLGVFVYPFFWGDILANDVSILRYSFPLDHRPPPSMVTQAPLIWLAALLAKNTTVPAISSGRPNLPFGFALAISASPPCAAIRPEAILEGKKPGAMLLQRMWRGPSSTARLRVRWIAAAERGEEVSIAVKQS